MRQLNNLSQLRKLSSTKQQIINFLNYPKLIKNKDNH